VAEKEREQVSRYIVWDAAKETGDVYDLTTDYNTKKVTTFLEYKGVKPTGLVHMMATEYGSSHVIGPGKWVQMVEDAKNAEALHNQEQGIEAAVKIDWRASVPA
jgi:sporulation protein YlmC with PRC-barrel domain